jgi:hypothetical protein
MTSIDESHCARCLRVPEQHELSYPGDDLPPADWEVLTDPDDQVIGVACPDCLTPEEQQEIDDDATEMTEAAEGEDE